MYYIDYVDVLEEQNDFNEGCTGKAYSNGYQYKLEFDTISGLIKKICHHFDIAPDEIEIDDCNKSVLRFVKLEDIEGNGASEHDIEKWKLGKKILYHVQYSICVKISTDFIFDKKSILDYIE